MSVTNSEQAQEIHNAGVARAPDVHFRGSLDFARWTRLRMRSDFVTTGPCSTFCTNLRHNAPRLWYDSPTFVGGAPNVTGGKKPSYLA